MRCSRDLSRADGGAGPREHGGAPVQAEDYPYGATEEEWRAHLRTVRERWGSRDYFEELARQIDPHANEEFLEWFVTCQRFCASPAAALSYFRVYGETDLRDVLPTIRVPTLAFYAPAHRDVVVDLAGRVPGARTVELRAAGFKGFEEVTREVEHFPASLEAEPLPDTVLATLLFTDIVGSTERAATLGDREWRAVLDRHHTLVRRELGRFRGEEKDTPERADAPLTPKRLRRIPPWARH